MKKIGIIATGFVVGYPPCPSIEKFKEFIETHYRIPVIVGTHPIPMKYFQTMKKCHFRMK